MTLLFFYLAFLSYLPFKGLFAFLPFYFFTLLPLKSWRRTEASIAI